MTTKITRLVYHVAELAAWNRGSNHPWDGVALLEAQELADLCVLAGYAPTSQIDLFVKGVKLADIIEVD